MKYGSTLDVYSIHKYNIVYRNTLISQIKSKIQLKFDFSLLS